MKISKARHVLVGIVTALIAGTAVAASPALASASDSFFTYHGAKPLASYAPGDVLKSRTLSYNVFNVPTPVKAVQILYRSENSLGQPVANTTSVLIPGAHAGPTRVVSYQSAYDSLNPADSPSRAISGNADFGSFTRGGNFKIGASAISGEAAAFAPLLAAGYTVNVPDTEGPTANFAAGPEYGKHTLNSLRALRHVRSTQVSNTTKIGLYGYSGGAIATNWAAIQAPQYAPEVNSQLVGATEGGVLVNPATNLTYISGSFVWGGVAAMAIAGLARAYDIDFDKYLNARAKTILPRINDASIINVLAQYPNTTWKDLTKPAYSKPNNVPEFVDVTNKVNMGMAPNPTIPLFIAQASNGILELTNPGPPKIGRGDGVMVAGDVRTLARKYCTSGARVQYDEYTALSHTIGPVAWLPGALLWLNDRFNGVRAPSNCGAIPRGNSLAPQKYIPSHTPAPSHK